MMFWDGDGHWYLWQAVLMWVGMIAFWGAMIWLVYSLVTRATGRGDDRSEGGSSARRILDERFARGEIDEDEYRRRRDTLDGVSGRSTSGTVSRL